MRINPKKNMFSSILFMGILYVIIMIIVYYINTLIPSPKAKDIHPALIITIFGVFGFIFLLVIATFFKQGNNKYLYVDNEYIYIMQDENHCVEKVSIYDITEIVQEKRKQSFYDENENKYTIKIEFFYLFKLKDDKAFRIPKYIYPSKDIMSLVQQCTSINRNIINRIDEKIKTKEKNY